MTIAILCPTYGRPKDFELMIDSLIKTAFNLKDIHFYIGLTRGDINIHKYISILEGINNKLFNGSMYEFLDWTLPMCYNSLQGFAANHDLFFCVSDDMIMATPGWDSALSDAYNALHNKIHLFSFQDNRDKDGIPFPILTREYINEMGYMLPPIFMHWYCDTWTKEIAQSNNCVTYLKDYIIMHNKVAEKDKRDETYHRIRRRGGYERDVYVNNTCGHMLSIEKQRLAKAIDRWSDNRYVRAE